MWDPRANTLCTAVSRTNQAETGHLKAAKIDSAKKHAEVRVNDLEGYELGQAITVEQFEAEETGETVAGSLPATGSQTASGILTAMLLIGAGFYLARRRTALLK